MMPGEGKQSARPVSASQGSRLSTRGLTHVDIASVQRDMQGACPTALVNYPLVGETRGGGWGWRSVPDSGEARAGAGCSGDAGDCEVPLPIQTHHLTNPY